MRPPLFRVASSLYGVGGILAAKNPKPKSFIPVESIKIGAYNIPVFLTDDYIPFGTSDVLGLYESNELRITLSTIVCKQRLKHIVCHEVCHAMADIHHIPMPNNDEQMEVVNDAFATALYAFIKDNPELVRWLMQA
jgi:hypothetical protein